MTLAIASVAAMLAAGTWVLVSRAETQSAALPEQSDLVSTLKVSGMTCGGCAAAVKMAAKNITGVTDADVSLETGTARVTYDSAKTTPAAIAKTITEKTGFAATVEKSERSKG